MKIFLSTVFLSLFLIFSGNAVNARVDYEEVKFQQYNKRIDLAAYYSKQGKYEEALELFISADKLLNRPATKFFIARTLFLAEKFQKAEIEINKAIAQYVQCQCVDFFYPEAFLLKADLLEMKGDTKGAIQNFTFVFFVIKSKETAQAIAERIVELEKTLAKRVNI